MSRIDELIKEKCPNGVDFKTLNNVTSTVNIGINPRRFFKLNPEDAEGFYVTVRELNGLKGVINTPKTDQISLDAVKIIQNRANIEKGDIYMSVSVVSAQQQDVLRLPLLWLQTTPEPLCLPRCSLFKGTDTHFSHLRRLEV